MLTATAEYRRVSDAWHRAPRHIRRTAQHESGHCVAAVVLGWDVDTVTLGVLGGSCSFTGPPPSPGADVVVSLAGHAFEHAMAVGSALPRVLIGYRHGGVCGGVVSLSRMCGHWSLS